MEQDTTNADDRRKDRDEEDNERCDDDAPDEPDPMDEIQCIDCGRGGGGRGVKRPRVQGPRGRPTVPQPSQRGCR